MSRRNVLAMDAARHKCVKDTQGAFQVKWVDIVRRVVPQPCTPPLQLAPSRAMGFDVKLRRSREKQQRTAKRRPNARRSVGACAVSH